MTNDDKLPTASAKATASELNNLLQIITGTTDLMENIWAGRDDGGKYLAMLRESIDRAAKLTADLVEQAGGATANVIAPAPHCDVISLAVARPAQNPRVLVVDDEPVMLRLLENLLSGDGYDVVTAVSGWQALDLLARDPDFCDLIVLDFTMPFMNGEETFRRIREIAPEIPVILATGFIHKAVLEGMLRAGLAGFISKPMPPNELLTSVRKVLRLERSPLEPCPARGIAAAN